MTLSSAVGKVDRVAFVLPFSPALSARRAHRVYLKNMFLSDAADNLLPDWAFFVRAVVNADDLRPTASRESFYEDAKLARVRSALGDCLRHYLVDLADKRPQKLEQFVGLHHRSLKALAAEDDEFFAVIIDHLPFETSMGSMTFGEYRREYDRVRYVPDVDSFRQVAGVTAAQGVCAINAGYAYEADLLARVPDVFPELTVEPLDPGAVAPGFDELTPEEQEAADDFLRSSSRTTCPPSTARPARAGSSGRWSSRGTWPTRSGRACSTASGGASGPTPAPPSCASTSATRSSGRWRRCGTASGSPGRSKCSTCRRCCWGTTRSAAGRWRCSTAASWRSSRTTREADDDGPQAEEGGRLLRPDSRAVPGRDRAKRCPPSGVPTADALPPQIRGEP